MMKQTLKRLEKQREYVRTEIKRRKDYINSRSDAWKKSAKAHNYGFKTASLIGVENNLTYTINSLKDFLKD